MSRLWIVRGFRAWSLLTVLTAVVAPGVASAQDTIAPSATPYIIEWHTAPMVRTAGLVDLSSRLIDRGANWSVDQIFGDLFQSPTKKGFGARLTKYVVFDTFTIAYDPAQLTGWQDVANRRRHVREGDDARGDWRSD